MSMQEVKLRKRQILTWQIGGHTYGGDANYCIEVQKERKILDVPHANNYIVGIVNLRGDIVTVLDLFALMGQPKMDENKKVIIRLKDGEKQVALLADSVSEVIEISDEDLESAENHLNERELKYIPYIVRKNHKLIFFVNIPELFQIS